MKKLYKYILPVFLTLIVVSCDDKEGERVEMKNQNPIVTVDEISPAEGYVGNEFTITGSNFGMLPEDVEVFVGSKKLDLLSCEDKLLTVKVPQGTTAGDVSVVVYGQHVDTKLKFDVLGEPAVLDVKPVYGFVGDAITFEGHDLLSNASFYKILFTGKDESALFATEPTDKSFQVNVPEGALSGKIILKISDREVNVDPEFTVLQHAVVNKLTPEEGFSGSIFTISGKDFNPALLEAVEGLKGIQVFFDKSEESAEIVGEPTNEEIKVRVPEGLTEGEHKISIATSFESIEQKFKFKVLPFPEVTEVSPMEGYIGAEVILSGHNFGDLLENIIVKFNNTPATKVVLNDDGNILVKVPGGLNPNDDVFITLNICGVDIPVNDNKFEVLPTPEVESVKSSNSISCTLVKEGDEVIITGHGFGIKKDKVSVYFEGVTTPAEIMGEITDDKIVAIVPQGFNEGMVTLKFVGIDIPIEGSAMKLLTDGADITEFVLKNYKQPFVAKGGGTTDGWYIPENWKYNTEALQGTDVGGMQINKGKTNLAFQRGYGRNYCGNAKLYQAVTLPAGKYKLVANFEDTSLRNLSKDACSVIMAKGIDDSAIPNNKQGGPNKDDNWVFTRLENLNGGAGILETPVMVLTENTPVVMGFLVTVDSNNCWFKIASLKLVYVE